jgi:hypothetical protein
MHSLLLFQCCCPAWIDKAVENTGDAVNDANDWATKAAEDTNDWVSDAGKAVGKPVRDAIDWIGGIFGVAARINGVSLDYSS